MASESTEMGDRGAQIAGLFNVMVKILLKDRVNEDGVACFW